MSSRHTSRSDAAPDDVPLLRWDRVAARWWPANETASRLMRTWHGAVTSTAGRAAGSPERIGALPPPPRPETAQFGGHDIWSDFARWCPTGLLVVADLCDADDPLGRRVIACNDAAGGLLGRAPPIGTPLARVFADRVDAVQREALEAALAGWGPQQVRVDRGHRALRVRVHRQPGGVVLGLEDASTDERIESMLDAQARALDARDRELDAFVRGLSRRLAGPSAALDHALTDLDAGADASALRGIVERLAQVDAALRESVELVSRLAESTFDETTFGRVDVGDVAAAVCETLAPEADALGVRLLVGALPSVRGIRREVELLLGSLIRHSLYDRAPGAECVLRLTCSAVRGGWRFVLAEAGVEPQIDEASAAMDAVDDFHLVICRRILRRRDGRLGRTVGVDGRRTLWFEWPALRPGRRGID